MIPIILLGITATVMHLNDMRSPPSWEVWRVIWGLFGAIVLMSIR